MPPLRRAAHHLPRWYWAAIPLLAIAAYISTAQMDFLGDDLWLLNEARKSGLILDVFVPKADWYFYRPLGTLFTWQLGWQVWGFNPVPYHLLSVLAHSLVSLVLGLWLAELTGKPALAWLAAAFFAVFPLHVEAVAWLAAQWDLWAALFGLLSLWSFTRWWRKREGKTLYLLSVFFFAAGLFTKESLLPFLPVFAATAWAAGKNPGELFGHGPRAFNWRRLTLALVPFLGVLGLNLGIRLVFLGRIGGYPNARLEYQEFIWSALIDCGRLLLSPINIRALGVATSQVLGVMFTFGLLFGLTLFGRANVRLIALAFTWLLLTLAPVLNLGVNTATLESSRFLYLPSIAYSVIVGAILYSAIRAVRAAGPWRYRVTRTALISGVGLLLVGGVVLSWAQIRPWRAVSVQARVLDAELLRLIPPEQRPRPMRWFVKNRPHFAYGLDVFSLGFGFRRFFNGQGDVPVPEIVESTSDAPVVEQPDDAFVVRFYYDEREDLFHADYLSGVTAGRPPPTGRQVGDNLLLWDFTSCAPEALKEWEVAQARIQCAPGRGLLFVPASVDGQMVNTDLDYDTNEAGTRFVRVRVAAQYDPVEDTGPDASAERSSQWFWTGEQVGFSEERSKRLRLKKDGEQHVYWSFIPADDTGGMLRGLRFDPINAEVNARILWIAVDQVK